MLRELGLCITQTVHGKTRSNEGFLLTQKYYLLDDQEIALGQSYLGLLGFGIFALFIGYVLIVYGYPGGGRGGRFGIRFSSFAAMPFELQILLPLAVVAHLTAMASIFRLVFHWSAISSQHRSNLEN